MRRKSTEGVSGVLEVWFYVEVQQTHKAVAQLALPLLQQAQRAILSMDAPAETWDRCEVQAGQEAAYRRLQAREGLKESSRW